jgi:uncharacterized protein (TIGR04255 family)
MPKRTPLQQPPANDPDREMYPNAPLQLVAWELRTPAIPEFLTPSGVVQSMSGRLRDLAPIVAQPETFLVVEPTPQAQPRGEARQRLLDRKQTLSITVGPTATIIETTAYTRFEEFAEVIERVVRAIESIGTAAGFERIGMRYIDEIRVPGIEDPGGWSGYINETLLARLPLESAAIASAQNLVEYVMGSNYHVTLRSGALVGRTVDSSGPLRLIRVEDGPYFLLDIDSYWTKPRDEPFPEFSTEEVLAISNQLRQPVRSLFEGSITEKLRDEVLRRPA